MGFPPTLRRTINSGMKSTWQRFEDYYLSIDSLEMTLDISRMQFDDSLFTELEPSLKKALADMESLEKGAIANPDEDRMVGHYWLRNPDLAPDETLKKAISQTLHDVQAFVTRVHQGQIKALNGERFTDVLIIGIGGSALGPQLVADALGNPTDPMQIHFIDNTDPDGIRRTLTLLKPRLETTLSVVISKSGGTKETRNGMLEAQAAYKEAGLEPSKAFVAITGEGSKLDQLAEAESWLHRFPMWDWVGGRTSVTSTVGLVPMALQGLPIEEFLKGAAEMDDVTRGSGIRKNPALLLAAMWHAAGKGKGLKDMVLLPYKDRLVLFSKYLQQLVMESLGKEKDLDGKRVHQGIAVYGNKGSTDQHAYVQQLRDGINNFFVTFIEVRRATDAPPLEVEPGITSGDYLQGFLRGTRAALTEGGRESITLSIPEVSARHLGALIALYERAVGFYASLVNVNAYHQPGVEAGKKAASRLLDLQGAILAEMHTRPGNQWNPVELAEKCDADPEDVYHCLIHLAANRPNITRIPGSRPGLDRFGLA